MFNLFVCLTQRYFIYRTIIIVNCAKIIKYTILFEYFYWLLDHAKISKIRLNTS